ncbi:MAG: hypothetical protein ACFFA4_05150 [Promethearchaeota archaeon]
MGLDKWLKSDDKKNDLKNMKIPTKQVEKRKKEQKKNKTVEQQIRKLIKYTLLCGNTICKYQRIIVKKQLSEKDRICPRCGKNMRVKEE